MNKRGYTDTVISLTPYEELGQGEESIHDHIMDGYTVPTKVIAYLRTTKPYVMSPGMYNHPFRNDIELWGPYVYTDDLYNWDRDTWKYVVKYGLVLPQDFIDHVMSEEGTRFLEEQNVLQESWSKTIDKWTEETGMISYLYPDEGNTNLDDF